MELKEMIKVMQHFDDGGEIEYREHKYKTWEKCPSPIWNWFDFKYRIKEQKQKVTIEKWLCKDRKDNYMATCSIMNSKRHYIGSANNPIDAFNLYKQFKESYIKQVADEYKQKYPNFPDKLYNAMYSYKVEITD